MPLNKKRSASEAGLAWEAEDRHRKPELNHFGIPNQPTPGSSYPHRVMTPQEDQFIWKRYQAHQEETQRRGLSKKASSGFSSQLAEELRTNRQTITGRLKVLRKVHGEQDCEDNSLQNNFSENGTLLHGADTEKTGPGRSEENYWTELFPGFCFNNESVPHHLSNHSSSSTVAPSVSATGSSGRRKEGPLASPPHIARKSSFSPEDDVILWNMYIRNGSQVLVDAQCIGLMKRLKRSNTSCIDYRLKRLVAQDQGVPINSIQRCAFTPTDDANILHFYHTNSLLPVSQQRSEDSLCRELSQQVKQEPVRVLYRLHYLLNHYESHSQSEPNMKRGPELGTTNRNTNFSDHEADDNSDVASREEGSDDEHSDTGTSAAAGLRETAYNTRNNKGKCYTEDEDMAIWTAYLSSTKETERNAALRQV